MNAIQTLMEQANWNVSDNDASAGSQADSGGNDVAAGLIAVNAANLATATSTAVNASPITQINLGLDLDSIIDSDADVL
ncbi:hypothetical protein [Acuticoccus sp.]|uniref:hypothetical protein n=1 Tax=Acuticoccus sp. TaxID=1904378 RepID=UPI003B51D11C